jgi:hypothetical protein
MIDINETATKAPTGYELAKARYNDLPDNPSMTSEALYWMVTSLATELAAEREIVRGRIAELQDDLNILHRGIARLLVVIETDIADVPLYPRGRRSIAERMAEAGEAAMPEATLAAVDDYWTVRPGEPADFAANYPAAQTPQPADDEDGEL